MSSTFFKFILRPGSQWRCANRNFRQMAAESRVFSYATATWFVWARGVRPRRLFHGLSIRTPPVRLWCVRVQHLGDFRSVALGSGRNHPWFWCALRWVFKREPQSRDLFEACYVLHRRQRPRLQILQCGRTRRCPEHQELPLGYWRITNSQNTRERRAWIAQRRRPPTPSHAGKARCPVCPLFHSNNLFMSWQPFCKTKFRFRITVVESSIYTDFRLWRETLKIGMPWFFKICLTRPPPFVISEILSNPGYW